ncbi:MAG TPA: 2-phosphosulfolactate phosphatase [Ktedonobacteraceae bacterium]|nr:2-phosphosulfolactate phosphatase [Ktedonobacteraceae bacterium]
MSTHPSHRHSQHPYRSRLDWGWRGVQQAVTRGNIVVIVDTLSFSTATVTAVHQGGIIYPCTSQTEAGVLAQQVGGELAVKREEVPVKGHFSLSPGTFLALETGSKVVLASPNGATCCSYGKHAPFLLVGTLVNARAVAMALSRLLERNPDLSVTVIACGERWRIPSEDGPLRVAVEDYLGAGAIFSYLNYDKSPEARVCQGAFTEACNHLEELLWDCASGRELRERGFEGDVLHAARLNAYETVPFLQDGHLDSFSG